MLSVKCWLAKGPLKACKNKPPWSNDNQTNCAKLGNTYLKNSLKIPKQQHNFELYNKVYRSRVIKHNENEKFDRNIIILRYTKTTEHINLAAQTENEWSGMLYPCRFTCATAFAAVGCNNKPRMNVLASSGTDNSQKIMRWCCAQRHCFIEKEQSAFFPSLLLYSKPLSLDHLPKMVDNTKSKLNLVFYSRSTSFKIYLGEKSAIILILTCFLI